MMIYLDNSATTYPKPPQVIRAVNNALRSYSFNPGRGGYRRSLQTAQMVYEARKTLKEFFNVAQEENVIFTASCTQALNTVIKGVLRQGDHVVISSLEHNAVLRPLYRLQEQGRITYTVVEVAIGDDEKTIDHFRGAINEHTRLIICTHASNVFGYRLPTERLCALAHQYEILFCLDTAQSAGLLPIDVRDDGYDFVCLAGHKYLYGPMGIGALLLGKDIVVDSLIEGGTGSLSDDPATPSFYPDRLEAGTLNIPGIMGLQAGVRFVSQKGTDKILQKENALISRLAEGLSRDERFILYRDPTGYGAPVLSLSVKGAASETVARYLSQSADIAVRAGLHCAPLAHHFVGTPDDGTVRIAPSVFTSAQDIELFMNSLRKFK